MINFRWCKIVTVSILLMGPFVSAASQELSDTLLVYFQKEKAIFERDYRENGLRTDEFIGRIRSLQEIGASYIVRLEMTGVASPEGDTLFNNIISNARRNAVYKYGVAKRHDRPTEQCQEQGEGRGPGRGRKLCLWTAKGRGGARAADLD